MNAWIALGGVVLAVAAVAIISTFRKGNRDLRRVLAMAENGAATMDQPPARRVLAVGTVKNGVVLMRTADEDLAWVLTATTGRH